MIAAASSDGSSWRSLAMSSADRPPRSAAPASGPSSLKASMASLELRSTRTENEVARSLSGSAVKTCARSAGCCFWSRLTRLDVAPMRISRLTDSRTTSILRWASERTSPDARSAQSITSFSLPRFLAPDAAVAQRVAGRHLEERMIGFRADDAGQFVRRLAGSRVGVARHQQDLKVRRSPLLRDDDDRQVVADGAGRNRRRHADSFGANALDRLRRKLFFFAVSVERLAPFERTGHAARPRPLHPGALHFFLPARLYIPGVRPRAPFACPCLRLELAGRVLELLLEFSALGRQGLPGDMRRRVERVPHVCHGIDDRDPAAPFPIVFFSPH